MTLVEALSAWLSCHRAAVCPAHGDTATFLRRRGPGAPSPRLIGAGDNFLGISSLRLGMHAPHQLELDANALVSRPPASRLPSHWLCAWPLQPSPTRAYATRASLSPLIAHAQDFMPSHRQLEPPTFVTESAAGVGSRLPR